MRYPANKRSPWNKRFASKMLWMFLTQNCYYWGPHFKYQCFMLLILGDNLWERPLKVSGGTAKLFFSLTSSVYLFHSVSQSQRDWNLFRFPIPFSINLFQHSQFRLLENTFSYTQPLSLSLSVCPDKHHMWVDSQLACLWNAWQK